MKQNIFRYQLIGCLFFIIFAQYSFASPYKLIPGKELSYFTAGAAMGLIGYINERDRTAPSIAELNTLNKNDVPRFERSIAGRWDEKMHQASDVLLLAGLASPALIATDKSDDLFTISILYAETLALSAGGMTLAKGTITRFRPYAYGDKAPLSEKTRIDTKRSFFSGHAALASSGLIFTATLFSDYNPDSKYKNHIWAGAIGTSLLVAGLRVAGGKHFPSDVITGLAWGSLAGYAVPAFHRKTNQLKMIPFTTQSHTGINFYQAF